MTRSTIPTVAGAAWQPPGLLHGGDYNPDQWPEEIWPRDMELMRQAGVNAVTVGVFSWPQLEPADGEYTFDWLDRVMDLLHGNRLRAILATPTAAHPPWLSRLHPEVLRTAPDRVRHEHRVRVNYCLTSPVYRRKCAAIAGQLANRYRNHPALLLWHVSNEYHDDCHCELCQAAFRAWLGQKYGSLKALNQAWDNTVWGHAYANWEEVRSPQPWPAGEWSILALAMDWRRFVNDQTVACLRNEIDTLRQLAPGIPITTNMHQTCSGMMDWARFAPHLDIVSWDNYPRRWLDSGDWRDAAAAAFQHDFYRCLKQRPFLMMESNPAAARGQAQKRPGVARLLAMQALAHGSDSVQYFQWRNCRSGVEKFHGAVVDHDGTSQTRVFQEVAALGSELGKLGALVGAMPRPAVAVVYDEEVHWATEYATTARWDERDYVEVAQLHYRQFWQRGVAVDVIASTADFGAYKLLVAPLLYLLRPGVAERLAAFVEAGGTFVTTYWSGYVDENDRAFVGGFPGPLRRLLGLWSEELDGLPPGVAGAFRMVDGNPLGLAGEFSCRHFCDLCQIDDAEVLATYAQDYYVGRPALTRKVSGNGAAYYLATAATEPFVEAFYEVLAKRLRLASDWPAVLPPGVVARARRSDRREFVFLSNFTAVRAVIPGQPGFADGVSGEPLAGTIELEPYGVKVLQRTL